MSAGLATAPRATLDLKVKVWGMGSNDRPFFQNAVAQNISATGACIFGIEQQLKVGDVIGVQYETKKARCKVIWVVDAGGIKKTQVGVQLVTDQECPWLAVLRGSATRRREAPWTGVISSPARASRAPRRGSRRSRMRLRRPSPRRRRCRPAHQRELPPAPRRWPG